MFSWLSWFFPLLLGFFATPIIVKGLGTVEYGLYALVIGLIGYTFAFGIGRTAAKYVAEYNATGETERINGIVSAAFWFSISLGILGVLVTALFSGSIVDDFLNIDPEHRSAAIYALYLASATILVYAVCQVFQSVLQGLHRFDRYSLLMGINGALLQTGNIAIVMLGHGMLVLLCWNLVVMTIISVLSVFSARALMPQLRVRANVGRQAFKAVLGYGTSIIIYQICGNIMVVFERAWITRKLGPEALTFYVIPMSLAIYMHGIISSIAAAAFPSFNELIRDREKLTLLYLKATKWILAIIVFIVVTLIASGREFLMVWINSRFSDNSYHLLILHTLTLGIIALFTIVWLLTEANHAASINAAVAFVWMVFAVGGGLLLIDIWQNEGVAFARFVGVAITLPAIPYLEKRFLGQVQFRFWGAILARIAVAGVLLAATEVLLLQYLSPGWLTLGITGAAGGAAFAFGLWVTGFVSADERRMFAEIIQNRR